METTLASAAGSHSYDDSGAVTNLKAWIISTFLHPYVKVPAALTTKCYQERICLPVTMPVSTQDWAGYFSFITINQSR